MKHPHQSKRLRRLAIPCPLNHESNCMEPPRVGQPSAVKAFLDMVKEVDPIGIFLVETNISDETTKYVIKRDWGSYFFYYCSSSR